MNFEEKNIDSENWRKDFKQATGLGQISHRGQCSNGPRTLNQDPSFSMTNQSLTAPIACNQQIGKAKGLHSASGLNQPLRAPGGAAKGTTKRIPYDNEKDSI